MEISKKAREAIEDIINRRAKIASMQEQLKEDVKAVAEHLDIKPGKLNKIIGLVEKERQSGEVVEEERDTLDTVESLVGERE
ncbi:MAG: hypothetical protein M1492_09100 [Gammaproteobacteria bacterium]|jgi:hypothetical protein|nr:hypothetical protein [Acidithiobacillus ferrooxidans]MCL4526609.1 hypothetical protein [Gammaproteobacteria bacterium]MCR1347494.1 hypothetical protein [Acidithiobacillus ferrooxidans]MCR1355353.1 hypothetical protein [Acidithiobacillus ferrooxidans]MDA8375819.1 hypothetical protein [Planctomycetia bacterium]